MKKLFTVAAVCFALTSNANPIDSTTNKLNAAEKMMNMQLAQRAQFYTSFRTVKPSGPGCPMQYELLHPGCFSGQRRTLIVSLVVFIGAIVLVSSTQPQ